MSRSNPDTSFGFLARLDRIRREPWRAAIEARLGGLRGPVTQIHLVTNWVEDLKARVAAGQAK